MIPPSLSSLLIGALATVASAAVVEYDWDITWVTAAPDGFTRPVIGVNDVWPCPEIRAVQGDTIRLKINNKLGNQTTSIHFHGINQIGSNWMDGPSLVTQCPVIPGVSFTYEFVADTAGTFWWHSHEMGQYPDGLRGPLIIEDPNDPHAGEYHEQSHILGEAFLNPNNPDGIPPAAQSIILNDGQGADYAFAAGKNYRFRIINIAAAPSAMIHFDSHNMTVIMSDVDHVEEEEVSQLRISPGQRYDVIVKGAEDDDRNFGILVALDENRDYSQPGAVWGRNATGNLIIDPEQETSPVIVEEWRAANDSLFKPVNDKAILPAADKTMLFNFNECTDSDEIVRHCVNSSYYVGPKVPTLYTAATTGGNNTKEAVYGAIHPFIVSSGDIIDIVVNNHDPGVHPFHLHGYHFQVLTRPGSNAGDWPGSELASPNYNQEPPRRDTVDVYAMSHAVLRFQASNPGVYLFHCHMDWHVEMGLTATIIESPELLTDITIPEDHLEACRNGGYPIAGNAAGNVEDPLDTTGIEYEPPVEYTG
ncbi:related to Conidial Pigment Biosynthesis protein brown1 [Cephalotrichum gorgonifer]|uniref:Related to Conidial Pigment Biosynthesis protein brown1 n=1 Tax=Cephalotrichum gorgonifer TaxID=2041049 RepID=A0AAE8N8Y6_9PEZI|nr:related to Conidial Pigment Biosynthesis protein brown1 [Cephalotrichum gorgonifer]